MIDDDFLPDRLQYRALGHLLAYANNYPLLPAMREIDLLTKVYGRYVDPDRREWLTELAQHDLIRIVPDSFRVGDPLGINPFDIYLTPAAIYYSISRASLFMENAGTPTDDFPDDIVDTPWALQSYFGPSSDDVQHLAPAADRLVRFDHNEKAFDEALSALDAVSQALASDNEIGSKSPDQRDEKLAELRLIRQLLEKREGWQSKLMVAGWGVLAYLMSHFADRPVAQLAEQAWHALQSMLGLL
jgi:hypothetical protein